MQLLYDVNKCSFFMMHGPVFSKVHCLSIKQSPCGFSEILRSHYMFFSTPPVSPKSTYFLPLPCQRSYPFLKWKIVLSLTQCIPTTVSTLQISLFSKTIPLHPSIPFQKGAGLQNNKTKYSKTGKSPQNPG